MTIEYVTQGDPIAEMVLPRVWYPQQVSPPLQHQHEEITSCSTRSVHDDSLLKVPDVARFLNVSEKSVRKIARNGNLRGTKLTKNSSKSVWLFTREDVDAYIKSKAPKRRLQPRSLHDY